MGNKSSILYTFSFLRIFYSMVGICMRHVRDVKNALSVTYINMRDADNSLEGN